MKTRTRSIKNLFQDWCKVCTVKIRTSPKSTTVGAQIPNECDIQIVECLQILNGWQNDGHFVQYHLKSEQNGGNLAQKEVHTTWAPMQVCNPRLLVSGNYSWYFCKPGFKVVQLVYHKCTAMIVCHKNIVNPRSGMLTSKKVFKNVFAIFWFILNKILYGSHFGF